MIANVTLAKAIKLRTLVAWYPEQWYWWYEEQHPLLDEMVDEGYLDRCIVYPSKTHWYRATELGVEQYHLWVERFANDR
jgi:hypothetical protein